MGNLKPIGSEKLEGIDKINRMIQIANYNLHVPQSINETNSKEFKKLLADGNTYHIVKEKNGYVLKRGLNEANSVYIEPMKNRKYYPSYSQALKRLNIVANEVNKYEGYNKNISLFLEDDREMEYYLTTEQDVAPEASPQVPVPAGPPAEGGEMTTPPPPAEGEAMTTPPMEGGEMPEPEMGGDEEPEDDGEEEVSFKSIQKATGKLAQKIRTFLSNEENEMSSKDIKYVINSVLSALNLENLEEDDLDEIMSRFEGGEDMEGGEEEMPEPDMEGGEEGMTIPPAPEGDEEEMTTPPAPPAGGEMAEIYPRHGRREKRDHYVDKMEEMIEGMFNESHVDKVLSRYFGKSEKTNKVSDGIYESYSQEKTTKRFMKEYPQAVFLGKTQKNNLIFNLNETKLKITPKGNIL